MKQGLVRFPQDAGGKQKGDDQQFVGVANLTPSLQDQCLSPAIAVAGGSVGRAAMPTSNKGTANKLATKQNDTAAVAKGAERESRSARPRKATKRSNKASAKVSAQPTALVTPTEEASGVPVEEPQIKPAKKQRRSSAKRKGLGWKRWSAKWLDQTLSLFHKSKSKSKSTANSKRRKPPGVRAKEEGTPLRRGAATQVMVYPRPKTKAALVRAARNHNQSVSSYMILASLEKDAKDEGCELADLGVPQDELEQYV